MIDRCTGAGTSRKTNILKPEPADDVSTLPFGISVQRRGCSFLPCVYMICSIQDEVDLSREWRTRSACLPGLLTNPELS